MKKNRKNEVWYYHTLFKTCRVMRITLGLLLILVMQGFASKSYSQKSLFNLDMVNVSIIEVLEEIENQTDFNFLFNYEQISSVKKVDVKLSNTNIDEALNYLLEGSNLKYKIIDRQIIISQDLKAKNILIGQKMEVTGKVTDSSGLPLPGVTIVLKGSTEGTITDMDGNYSMSETPSNAILVFSFVGMATQEISVMGKTSIDITMLEDAIGLEEVVAVGYGTMKKRDLTGAVSSVEVEKLKDVPQSNFLQTLQGRVPGLYIETTGDPSGDNQKVLIRGVNTLGNNSPLYIIDGVPTTRSDAMNNIDPNTIESFQVLKDASAASIYGSRASNGVIIITTKHGKEKFRVDFQSSITTNHNIRKYDVCSTEEFGRALWQASINDGTSPDNIPNYSYNWHTDDDGVAFLDEVIPIEWIGGDESYGLRSANTDWQDEVYRTGIVTSNNLTLSSASEHNSLLVSMGYLHNNAVLEYNDYKKYMGRINSSISMFKDRLVIGENLQIARTSETPYGGDGFIRNSLFLQPILPVYTTDGEFSGPVGSGFSDRNNPLQLLYLQKDNRINNLSFLGDINAKLELTKNLTFQSSFGIDYTSSFNRTITKKYESGFLKNTTNSLRKDQIYDFNWIWTNTINYKLKYKEHSFELIGGSEAIKASYENMRASIEDFADQTLDFFQFNAGTGVATVSGNTRGHQLLSYFGKVNYQMSDKYLATATLRYDGSSRFGKENQFGLFPAFTLGWRISNESFMSGIEAVSNLKLRAGAGRVGNQEIGDEARFGLYAPNYGTISSRQNVGTAYDLNGNNTGILPSGYVRTQLENPSLKWETTDEINIGLDFGFLKEKVYGTVDYFTRETKDILTHPPYPGVIGEGGDQYVNGATMENKGFEFVLGHRNQIRDFTYNITGSITSFKDKITYLPESVVNSYPGNVEKTIIGHSTSSVFGYVTDGIFQNQQEVDNHVDQTGKGIGRLRYVDLNDDGKIDPLDQDWLGTTLPDFTYGINSEFYYKGFSLSIFMQGVSGKTIRDGNRSFLDFTYDQGMNFGTRTLSAWTPQNTESDIPMLSLVNKNNELVSSNYFLVSASYFKVSNIKIAYTIPKKIISRIGIKDLNLYLMGDNVILIRPKGNESYSGPDPETPGYLYPKPLGVTLGFKLTL
ncbi:TonB-dependent receptor [Sunxiuqinia sp. A32]|uniref:TonB-dependent receptor n=1 Tax=Sunxiuqinia sp. A32 TaxID=3461496 RepID=UPI00404640D7